MSLFKQFCSLYALMSLLGMHCVWIDEKSQLVKFCYCVYSNALVVICAAFIIANTCSDCKFAQTVNCTQKHTVYTAEVLLANQTLVILLIMRNYYMLYAKAHKLLLLRLEYLCNALNLSVRSLATRTCACLAIIVIPKLLILFPFHIMLSDQDPIKTLILGILLLNTLIIVIYIMECSIVLNVLGMLFTKFKKTVLDGDRYYHYGMLLLETVDVINDFYGMTFLLVCTQQLSWITVWLYRHWVFPEEMMHFNDAWLRAWNRFALLASVAMTLEFLFASSTTISKANETALCTRHFDDYSMKNTKVAKQINKFLLKNLHQKKKFSAYGFFDIDNSVIYTVFSSIITYLVILIQFKQLENDLTHSDRNGTSASSV